MVNYAYGKILEVNLSSGDIAQRAIDPGFVQAYVGGMGFSCRLLYDEVGPDVDPLGPGNTLGLVTGPLTGTQAITGNRFVAVGKSPKTGGWGDANCGGRFGPALKQAEIDEVFLPVSPKNLSMRSSRVAR